MLSVDALLQSDDTELRYPLCLTGVAYSYKRDTMHFLFISTFLGPIGGIETLIARMSNWLVKGGHQVTLLTNNVRESRELFHKGMRIIELGDQLSQLCFCHKFKRIWADLRIERPDVIKAFDLQGILDCGRYFIRNKTDPQGVVLATISPTLFLKSLIL